MKVTREKGNAAAFWSSRLSRYWITMPTILRNDTNNAQICNTYNFWHVCILRHNELCRGSDKTCGNFM